MKPPFKNRRTLAPWILIAGLAGTAHAQAPSDSLRIQSDRVYHDVDAEGALWARGASFKARFAAEGTTFVPRFAPTAPRNFPIDLRLNEVTLGGAPIPFDASVAPERSADRISYDRGTFLEVYDLTSTEMEQSFVFESLPARGELVVRVQVTSELARASLADRIELSNEHGRVGCSRAVAIDADGVRTPLALTLAGDELEMRVPADVVDRARLPLVVDPVFGTYTVVNGFGHQGRQPDVSFDRATHLSAYVVEDVFSGADHDVFFLLFLENGAPHTAGFVDLTDADWRNPKIANAGGGVGFLVAAEAGPTGSRQIFARLASLLSTFGTPILVSVGAAGDNTLPDVGGDGVDSGWTRFAVVWQCATSASNVDILYATVDPATIVAGPIQNLTSGDNVLDRHPSISKGLGTTENPFQGWNVVWDHQVAAGNRDIRGAQILWDGSIASSAFTVDNSPADDAYPTASSFLKGTGGPNYWLAAWQRTIGPGDLDIVAAVLDFEMVQTTANLSLLEGSGTNRSQIAATADSDGRQFVVAYMETTAGTSTSSDIYVSQYAFTGGALHPTEVHQLVAATNSPEQWPQIHAERSSGEFDKCTRIVWSVDNGGNDVDAHSAEYCGQTGGSVTTVCAGVGSATPCPCGAGLPGHGCPNSVNAAGGLLQHTGQAAVTSDSFVLLAANLPTTTSCLYFQGTGLGTGAQFGDGLRCVTGSVIRIATDTASGGAASYPGFGEVPISVRGQLPAGGGARTYQVWYRNPASFCTSATFNLTNGLRVVWVP